MKKLRSSHLDRILGRLDDLDSVNLAIVVQRLARERALLETVFHTVQEGILVIDRSGVIQYANAAAHRLVGLREHDIGVTLLWKFAPQLQQSLGGYFTEEGGTRPVSLTRELEVSYPEHRFLRLYLVPLDVQEASAEDRDRTAVILTDITEDKISTEQQIESERLRSIYELAAGVAHEIGNPLNSINIHLQLMRRQAARLDASLPQRAKIDQAVGICETEIQRLDGIINHFLQAIRPQPPDLREMQLMDAVTEVLGLLGPELNDLQVRVEVAMDAPPPLINADPAQLKQVFFNVLKNAMEAMDKGGDLRLSTNADEETVYLYIADTGSGIEQEDLAKIFQPFYTSKNDGNGLGMMIVQRIMHDHGGQIGLDSEPGKGTVVTLSFPQSHRRVRMLQTDGESVADIS